MTIYPYYLGASDIWFSHSIFSGIPQVTLRWNHEHWPLVLLLLSPAEWHLSSHTECFLWQLYQTEQVPVPQHQCDSATSPHWAVICLCHLVALFREMDHTVFVKGGVWLTCHIQSCQLEPLSHHFLLSAQGPVAPTRNKGWGESNICL